MPEILTKHPDVVRDLLQQAGGKCGGDQQRSILKDCPPSQFCTVPGGEMCIYGIDQASMMTQISSAEFRDHACSETEYSRREGAMCGATCELAPSVDASAGSSVAVAALALAALWLRRGQR